MCECEGEIQAHCDRAAVDDDVQHEDEDKTPRPTTRVAEEVSVLWPVDFADFEGLVFNNLDMFNLSWILALSYNWSSNLTFFSFFFMA